MGAPEDRTYPAGVTGSTTNPLPIADLNAAQVAVRDSVYGAPRRSRFERAGKLALMVSVTITERHNRKATVAEHPVETGSSIADNRTRDPEGLDIDGALSDIFAYDEPAEPIEPSTGIFNHPPPATEAYAELERLWESDETFDFVTGLRIYRDYLLTALSTIRDKDTGQIVRFTASMRQIVYADSQVVAAVVKPKTQKVVPKRDKGPATKRPFEGPPVPSESTLQKIFNGRWRRPTLD